MKKLLVSLLILIILGSVLFFFGWVSFFIPAGQYGVLVSKTGGTHEKTLNPGVFHWYWEHIIPTNAKILNFDVPIQHVTTTAKGILPSGELYQRMFEGRPDFSWEITVHITGHVDPEALPHLSEKLSIIDQEALNQWTEDSLKNAAVSSSQDLIRECISDTTAYETFITNPASLANEIKDAIMAEKHAQLAITSVTIEKIKIPDFSLYLTAKETYAVFQQNRSILLAKIATDEAGKSVSEYLQIERMGQWGELLSQYPILIEFLNVMGSDSTQTIKTFQK